MANEKRLIDVQPLVEDGWHLVKTGKSNVFLASMSLADVPSVDAVEVVRCKDCKHYENHKLKVYENCVRNERYIPMKPDDFCSYGERREGE